MILDGVHIEDLSDLVVSYIPRRIYDLQHNCLLSHFIIMYFFAGLAPYYQGIRADWKQACPIK